MANQKIPSYWNAEQRQALMEIPSDLSERDLARYYSFTQEELKLISSRRRSENRFGFAVQLALLRFPGRPLAEYHGDFRQVPHSILKTISHQIELPVSIYREYGQRISTLYEHIEDICKKCRYRRCGWKEYLRNLYSYQSLGDYGPLSALLAGPVRAKYILENWEEMQRLASSIRHGSVSASLLMRRLSAYSRQNRLATALSEMGKLERTSFLLDYFQDESLRRRILIGLNKGEALHALARQLGIHPEKCN